MTPTDAATRIARAEELDAAATPGPWTETSSGGIHAHDGAHTVVYTPDGYDVDLSDARFIAESRTLLPALAADAKRLREEAKDWRAAASEAVYGFICQMTNAQDFQAVALKEIERLTEERKAALKSFDFFSRQVVEVEDELRGLYEERDVNPAPVVKRLRAERDLYRSHVQSVQKTWTALVQAREAKDADAIAKADSDYKAALSGMLAMEGE